MEISKHIHDAEVRRLFDDLQRKSAAAIRANPPEDVGGALDEEAWDAVVQASRALEKEISKHEGSPQPA